jgi:hypothetical protein
VGLKTVLLSLAMVAATCAAAPAADAGRPVARPAQPVPDRLPLALRNLSKRSASILAHDACWRGCVTECGGHFQYCIRVTRFDGCLQSNNLCELACLRHCRLGGGPLMTWTH